MIKSLKDKALTLFLGSSILYSCAQPKFEEYEGNGITGKEARELSEFRSQIILSGIEERSEGYAKANLKPPWRDCFTNYDKGIRLVAFASNKDATGSYIPRTEFEKSLQNKFNESPNPVEAIGNDGVFYYATPVRISSDACKSCHPHQNNNIGDIVGALSFELPIKQQVK